MKVVGLAGPAGSGKDTVADMLVIYHRPAIKLAFSDPLKEACSAIFGWHKQAMEDRTLKEEVDPQFGVSPRYAMQTLGTEWGRQTVTEDLWLKVMQKRLAKARREQHRMVVIPGVRFPNEVELVHSFGGTVAWVENPTVEPVNPHVSEQLDRELTDCLIPNLGDLQDLDHVVRGLRL